MKYFFECLTSHAALLLNRLLRLCLCFRIMLSNSQIPYLGLDNAY